MRTDQPITSAAPLSSSAVESREILRTRARALARPPAREQVGSESGGVVEFRLAQERYAIDQADVREVHPLKDLTPLPSTPAFLLGIINVRGQILPVIDLRRFFDLPEAGITDMHVVVIVHACDVELGILADAITGIRSISPDALQPPPSTLTGIRAKYLKGVTADRVAILDVRTILTDAEIVVQEEVEDIR